MCIGNERKPTEKEIAELTVGYKVFCTIYWATKEEKEKLCGLFQNYFEYKNPDYDGWFNAEDLNRRPDDAGFYVFKTKKNAKTLLKIIKNRMKQGSTAYYKPVIRKVMIGNIIGIGDVYNMMGYPEDDMFPKDCLIRCEKIKIIST
jgi:proteasome assembly chaperone (PAC2) family protein